MAGGLVFEVDGGDVVVVQRANEDRKVCGPSQIISSHNETQNNETTYRCVHPIQHDYNKNTIEMEEEERYAR